MSFESFTIETLEADSAILAAASSGITFVTAPQDRSGPHLVLLREKTDPTLSTDVGQPGSSELDRIGLKVECFAKTLKQANELATMVKRLLERTRPTVYVCTDRMSDYSDLPDLYNTVLLFDCWHPDSIPLDEAP